jgi:hypothetical protein
MDAPDTTAADTPDVPSVAPVLDVQLDETPSEAAGEPQPVDGDGQLIPTPTVLPGSEAPASDPVTMEEEAQREQGPPAEVDVISASGVDSEAIQAAYDEAERLEQQANGTPWPTHDITTGLCTASTVLIEPEQPSDPKFDRVPQKQILRTQQ